MAEVVEVAVENLNDNLDQHAVDGYMTLMKKAEELESQQAIGQPDTAAEEGGAANNAANPAEPPAEKPNEDGAADEGEDADEVEPDESSRGNANPVNRTAVNRPSHCKLNWGDTYKGPARVVEGEGWGRSRHMPTSADRVPAQPPAVGEPAEEKPAAEGGEDAAGAKQDADPAESPPADNAKTTGNEVFYFKEPTEMQASEAGDAPADPTVATPIDKVEDAKKKAKLIKRVQQSQQNIADKTQQGTLRAREGEPCTTCWQPGVCRRRTCRRRKICRRRRRSCRRKN